MRFVVRTIGSVALLGLLLPACRPDQIEHIRNGKQIATDLENMTVKRILPADLLRAARWAGDSLTRSADQELRRLLQAELKAGGVEAALPYCRPEAYASTDSLAHTFKANPRRLSRRPRNPQNLAPLSATDLRPDTATAHLVRRSSAEIFIYQRPILLSEAQCLRCHGEVGKDISVADFALIRQKYPTDQATGYRLGDAMGMWQVRLHRDGVAELYTMKTRKVMKKRKPLF
ncbi:Protein of unknown function [Hymenobacter daecheongensis DSM 21074]|uniref:Tll0287-like domain-containing protein n=1 Tax=Hymenobacter daecheongensis DSM 21074 TaxID=1121955 RepID=A0A1M6AWZ5_9BACT|nr:DUF3365 domain-containing protein [Hymenobacter daecheongensis]SHI40733.1 Protein of unknown function [Hymenobacter daecheongensis DSM 21074]